MEEREEEIQRIAFHLWVLAAMPKGGPDRFRAEAEAALAKRREAAGTAR